MNPNLIIQRGNITCFEADVIVNAANTGLWHGGGVDGMIRDAAGPEMDKELNEFVRKNGRGIDVGGVAVSKGYRLPNKYVFHTAGPDCRDEDENRDRKNLLKRCYVSCLSKAIELNVHSIAFPAISTGIFGYPKDEAAEVVLMTVNEWLESQPDYSIRVVLLCYSQRDEDVYLEAKKNLHL